MTSTAFQARFVHWRTLSNGRISRFAQIVGSVKVAEVIPPTD